MTAKVYFSKTSHLPCVEFNDKIFKAGGFTIDPKTVKSIKGQWFINESPGWAIMVDCTNVEIKNNTIIIK